MIKIDLNLAVATNPDPDLAALAGAAMNGAGQLSNRYPQSEIWEITAVWDRARYSVRNALGQSMGKVQAVGPRANSLRVGQVVTVCYYDRDRRKPYIKTAGGWTDWGDISIAVALGLWNQSNSESHQNCLGDFVPTARLDFAASRNDWRLPTTNSVGVYEDRSVAFGMARVLHEGDDTPTLGHYVTAWPVRRVGFDLCDLAAGGWDATTHSVVWQSDFVTGMDWPVSDADIQSAKFFYTQLGRWCNFFPRSLQSAPVCYSAKDGVTATTTFSKPAINASVHCWTENDTPKIRLILPYTDAASIGAYQSIEFYSQDVDTGAMTTLGTLDVSAIAGAGYPPIQNGHAYGGAVAWWENRCILFSSGLNSAGNASAWATKGLTSAGVVGTVNKLETQTASSSPTALTEWMFTSLASSTPYVADWIYDTTSPGVDRWLDPTATTGSTTSTDFATWSGVVPVLFPTTTPNTTRLGTFTASLGATYPAAANSGGGLCVDGTTVWGCRTKPSQWLHGGEYTQVITSGAVQTYRVYQDQRYYPLSTVSNDAYSLDTGASVLLGYTGTVGATVRVFYNPGPYTTGDLISIDIYVEDLGMKPVEVGQWTYSSATLLNTVIFGIDLTTGTYYETDISQLATLSHTVSLERDGSTSQTATRDNVPIVDNVHKLISLPGKSVLAVLRDRHMDGLGNNPSVCLEIYDYSSSRTDMPLLATVALGTQDLCSEETVNMAREETYYEADSEGGDQVTFNLPMGITILSIDAVWVNDVSNPVGYTYTAGDPGVIVLDNPLVDPDSVTVEYTESVLVGIPDGTIDGDRAWNPYEFGPPRMKATAALTDGGGANPALMIAVYESKKVTTEFQSEFRRAVYHAVDLSDPSTPAVATTVETSADLGLGGGAADPGGDGPLWRDWDSLAMAGGAMTWLRNSSFHETDA